MVGVPGRSQGCHSCRRQKIACSRERPECFICRDAGRACPGYIRETVFVITPSPKDGSQSFQARQYSRSTKPAQSHNKTLEHRSSTVHAHHRSSKDRRHNTALLSPQRSLTLAAYRQQILCKFLSRFEPKKTGTLPISKTHWLAELTKRPVISHALEVAATAFCTAKLGRVTRNADFLVESLHLYNQGLGELRRALYNPSKVVLDDTLGACLLLAMYEVVECPTGSSRGYSNHVAGCGRLVQLRGPEAHAEGLGHSIFVSFRFMAVSQKPDSCQHD